MKKTIVVLCLLSVLGFEASVSWAESDMQQEAQVRVLCQQLLADYAVYRDHQDADNFANTFAEDGVLIVGSGTHIGRDAIRDYILDLGEVVNAHMFMFTTHHIVIESEDRAKGLSYALVLGGDRPVAGGDSPIQVEGVRAANEYHTEFELTDEGWKIAKLSLQGKFSGPR